MAHVSPLLRKFVKVSGCSEDRISEWLLKAAIERGASHYVREFRDDLPEDRAEITNEEIGVGLCLGLHSYESANVRAAAQLLSSKKIDPVRLARLARMERVELVLLHIAKAAERFIPDAEPWAYVRKNVRSRQPADVEFLPHWSRFVSQTGVTPFGGGPEIRWLFRREPRG